MNRLYIKHAEIYMAFRMQLASKFVFICLMFGSSLPILYLFAALFFRTALTIDRINFFRRMSSPPRTTARLVTTVHHTVFPLGLAAHSIMATVFFYELPTNDERGDGPASRPPPHAPPTLPGVAAPPSAPPASPPNAPEHRHSPDQLYAIYTSVAVALLVLGALVVWTFRRVFPPLRTPRIVPKAILSRVGEFSQDAGNWRVDMTRMRPAGGSLYVSPINAWLVDTALWPSHAAAPAAGPLSELTPTASVAVQSVASASIDADTDVEAADMPRAPPRHRRTNSAPKFLRTYMSRSEGNTNSSELHDWERQLADEMAQVKDRPSAARWRMRPRPPSEVAVSCGSAL